MIAVVVHGLVRVVSVRRLSSACCMCCGSSFFSKNLAHRCVSSVVMLHLCVLGSSAFVSTFCSLSCCSSLRSL